MTASGNKKTFLMLIKEFMKPMDLTVGKPWKVILRYAWPIVISYLLQEVYALADAIICGQVLIAEQVAGINNTFPLTFIFLQFAFGCTSGFSAITAKEAGKSDASGFKKAIVAQIYLTVIISAILTVVSLIMINPMLAMINVTPENIMVYQAAYDYCFVIFCGTIALMGYNFICGALRAYGDSVTPLIFLAFSTMLNVVLDVLFLVAFGMGPIGAAIATVTAQVVSAVACFIYTFIRYKELRLKRSDFRASFAAIFESLKRGLPLGFQFSILAFGIIVMQGAVVQFDIMPNGIMVAGTPVQNGYGAACKLGNVLMAFFLGLSSAMLGYTAQNYGKGDYERIKTGTRQSLIIMFIVNCILVAVGMLLSINGAYQYIFLSADKVTTTSIAYGNAYLYTALISYVFLGALFVLRSIDQGIERSGYVLAGGIAELVARVLICAFLPAIVNGAPVDNAASIAAFVAVSLGDTGAWVAACVFLAIPVFKCIFKKHKSDGEMPY